MAYSVKSLARKWGCGPQSIYRLINQGELVGLRLGPKMLRITDDEVKRYEAQCRTNGDSAVTVTTSPPSQVEVRADAELSSMKLMNKAHRLLSDASISRRNG